ncbi:SLAM family member 8 [Pangasianodon hypophthalmus]|uniref:SLAM family member 8 n=1 Tax=Pangasianodon hypophthalmus TaxID=310915 RepID=UPI0023072E47|nr:SLAM family member 8 [Pangasianodon hypophthalmus]
MLQSVAIQLICMVVCFHQAVRGEDVRNVIGYIGESIVLRSEVDPSWKLRIIRWSIYKNITLIATFVNNEIRVNRWPQFKGRLELNTSLGDLTIKNIMARDSMDYRVYLKGQGNTEEKTSLVQLYVREQFPEPNITLLHSFLDGEKCVISLKCSSLGSNISLMWKPEHGFSERFWSDSPNVTRESVMWTSFRNRDVSFSCIATDHNRNMSRQLSVKCPVSEYCSSCYACWIILGMFFSFAILFILFKGQIMSLCSRCHEWLRNLLPSVFSRGEL